MASANSQSGALRWQLPALNFRCALAAAVALFLGGLVLLTRAIAPSVHYLTSLQLQLEQQQQQQQHGCRESPQHTTGDLLHRNSGESLEHQPHSSLSPPLLHSSLNRTIPQTLVLYELYYSKEGWSSLHEEAPYRPLCVHPGAVRQNSSDLDAPKLFPLIQDKAYQQLLCEYGAIFAVDLHLEELQGGATWVAFQSWRAEKNGQALSKVALASMARSMREQEALGNKDVFYFWSYIYPTVDMYSLCNK